MSSRQLSPPISLEPARDGQTIADRKMPYFFLITVLLAALVIAIYYDYSRVIVKPFAYQFYELRDVTYWEILAASAIALGAAFILPRYLKAPSDIALWLIYLFLSLPVLFLPIGLAWPEHSLAVLPAAIMTLSLPAIALIVKRARIRVSRLRIPRQAFWLGVAAVALLTYLPLIPLALPNFGDLRISDPYDLRADYAETLRHLPSVLGYTTRWVGLVINPLFLAYGLVKKRAFLVAAAVVGELFLFAATGYRQFLAAVLLTLAVVWAARRGRQVGLVLLMSIAMIAVVAFAVDTRSNKTTYSSLLIKRTLLSNGLTTQLWYEYFSAKPQLWYSQRFRTLTQSTAQATDPAPIAVARYFYGTRFSANASFLADGYANAGWAGVAISTLIVAGLLVLLNSFARGTPPWLGPAVVIGPVLSLVNGSAFTALLTHGGLFACLVLATYPVEAGDPDAPDNEPVERTDT